MPTDYLMCGRPKNCRYCGHAYYGLLHMVTEAQQRGFNIYDLAGGACTKSGIYSGLQTYDPVLFFGIGHGNTCIYTDDRMQPVWECTSLPPNNLSGRISYLWSCLTGIGLGPKIIELGGWAYAGFNVSWTWISDDGTDGDPYDDKYALGFYESGNEFTLALLQMKTVSEAGTQSRDKYTEWINYWKTDGASDPYASQAIKWLVHDRDSLVILGDQNARLGPAVDCSQFTNKQECLENYCFWWNNSCHSKPPTCEEINNEQECLEHNCEWYDNACHKPPTPECSDYTNRQECEANNCYWWNDACHDSRPICNEINNIFDCSRYGCYWYDGACHSSPQPPPPPPDCEDYTNQTECEANNCYWYNNSCHGTRPICDELNNQLDCERYGCHWYNNSCHSEPLPPDSTEDLTIEVTKGEGGITFLDIYEEGWSQHPLPVTARIKNYGEKGRIFFLIHQSRDREHPFVYWEDIMESGETKEITAGIRTLLPKGYPLWAIVGHFGESGQQIDDDRRYKLVRIYQPGDCNSFTVRRCCEYFSRYGCKWSGTGCYK